ncbi:MAG: hypothetical protein KGZ50_08965, partial [Peptococcaceae bacterium]|nr:hypothetical protein [Peptococcaceae bacterium]
IFYFKVFSLRSGPPLKKAHPAGQKVPPNRLAFTVRRILYLVSAVSISSGTIFACNLRSGLDLA